MKKIILFFIFLFLCNTILAEVPVKYNHNLCKFEIITSQDIKQTRNTKKNIEKQVLEFCKDKYIYDINCTIDKQNNYIYLIFYNDKVE